MKKITVSLRSQANAECIVTIGGTAPSQVKNFGIRPVDFLLELHFETDDIEGIFNAFYSLQRRGHFNLPFYGTISSGFQSDYKHLTIPKYQFFCGQFFHNVFVNNPILFTEIKINSFHIPVRAH